MPLAEHDLHRADLVCICYVSIHVPLAEHDWPLLCSSSCCPQFQFTCPSRSTTSKMIVLTSGYEFQFTCPSRSTTRTLSPYWKFFPVSIHVPLAEHDSVKTPVQFSGVVSIHVPLAEHDRRPGKTQTGMERFNSRAPRGARHHIRVSLSSTYPFQFTCPSRSTTA